MGERISMANGNFPFGVLPLTSATGSTGNFEMAYAPIAYDNATKIFRGDPVLRLNTGYIGQWVATSNVGNMAGIFWGCHYLSSATGTIQYSQYWPGADVALSAQPTLYAEIIPVNTGQPAKFYVQSDSTGVGFLDIGANCDLALGTGNTFNGQSGAYIDHTTINTTNTLPFRIIDLYGSSSFGAFGGGGVSGVFPGAQVAGVAQPYAGIGATYPTTGAAPTAIAYNWVIVQANVTSTGTGI
jgi:hypothetical protein